MGRGGIIILGLLLVMVVLAVASTTNIKDTIYDVVSDLIYGNRDNQGINGLNQADGGDKKVCGTCHSDKSNDFKKRYQHAPFVRWQCTDCHIPHTLGTGKYEFVVQIDKLCSSCHFDRKGEMKMSVQHKPFGAGRCTDCHDPHASDYPKQLILPQKQLCVTCHNVDMKWDFAVKHPPFAKGNCTDCHSPHASNDKGLTKLPGKQLCFTCHYDRQNELTLPVKHKPYDLGECANCHGPHATPNPKLLLLSTDKLCFSCHVEKVQESKVGYQHKPFVTGACVGCHVPHASENDSLLKRKNSELCYMCHTAYADKFAQAPSRHPVGNGLLECYGCHDPHSGPGEKMTRGKGNELCYICHLGLKDSFEKLAHATKAEGKAGKGQCLNCHTHHFSQNKPLLSDKQEAVCGNCHGKIYKAAVTHPVGGQYKDSWHGGTVHCTSCHGPHGTQNKSFTLLKRKDLCLKCHGKPVNNGKFEIHRTVPPKNEKMPKTIITKVPSSKS